MRVIIVVAQCRLKCGGMLVMIPDGGDLGFGLLLNVRNMLIYVPIWRQQLL